MSLTLQDAIARYFNLKEEDSKTTDNEISEAEKHPIDPAIVYASYRDHITHHHASYDYDSGVYDEYSTGTDEGKDKDDQHQVKKKYRRRRPTLHLSTLMVLICSALLSLYIHMEDTDIFYLLQIMNEHGDVIKRKKSSPKRGLKKNQMNMKMHEAVMIKDKKLSEDAITSFFDQTIISQLNKGKKLLENKKFKECEIFFDNLVKKFPKSPRAIYGKAKCIEKIAHQKRDENILNRAFQAYEDLMDVPNVPIPLARLSTIHMAEKCIEFGQRQRAVRAYKKLSSLVPNDLEVLEKLGVSHLYIPNYYEALDIFFKIHKLRPGGWTQVHIGYTYKMVRNFTEAIRWLEDALETDDRGVHHSRFYYSLADTYFKVGRHAEAYQVYSRGADKGLFLSTYQRPIYLSSRHLLAQPWWTAKEADLLSEAKFLRLNWRAIHNEAMTLLSEKDGYYTISPQLIDYGNWRLHLIFKSGNIVKGACSKTPFICSVLEDLKKPLTNQRGEVSFNVLHPMTHIWPHVGPTNTRLRLHLAISVPDEGFIRVADHVESWRVGRTLIFDDSFEYEMWNNSTNRPLVFLSIDFWHPEVPKWEKKELHSI